MDRYAHGDQCTRAAHLDSRGDRHYTGSMPTETEIKPDQKQQTRRQILPPWRVMLHNDDVNDMVHVIRALLGSVPSLTRRRATEIMMEAHLHRVAQVIVCPKEHAEMYRERLEQHGLTSTIEPA